MDTKQLQELLTELVKQPNESEFVEFQLDFHSAEELGEQLSALSNSACICDQPYGYLVFGVEENTHRIVGASFKPKTYKLKGNEGLEVWLASRFNPNIDFTIYEFNFDKTRHIAIFKIPATKDHPVEFLHAPYIRAGGVARRLIDFPDKQAKIRKKNTAPFEGEIAKNNLTASDITHLLSAKTCFDLMKLPYPSTQRAVIDKFVEEGLIVKGKKYAITKWGALLFAKNLSDFEGLDRKTIRVIVYKDESKRETVGKQTGKKGYAIGFENLVNWVAGQLPANEETDSASWTETGTYPYLAVRELVGNMLIHQDFSEKGFPLIEVYSDRIEFSNPGLPLVPPERFIDSHYIRNEKLSDIMRRMGFCEGKGSGIDKVIAQNEFFQLPPISIIAAEKRTKLILYCCQTQNELNKKEKILACYQHACLQYVRNEKMTHQTLGNRFSKGEGENSAFTSKVIDAALGENLIKEGDVENSYLPFWA
jgi:predicted HTH transcriptional regulator